MSSNYFSTLNINTSNIQTYKKKMIYFTSKALIYGCLFTILFRKPKTFFPITLGLATGYCNSDLIKIVYPDLD